MEITGREIRNFVEALEAQAQGQADAPIGRIAAAFKAAFPAAFTPVNITEKCAVIADDRTKENDPYYKVEVEFAGHSINYTQKDNPTFFEGVGLVWVAIERASGRPVIRVWCLPD